MGHHVLDELVPGAGRQQPSFHAGMETHYASFVRFEAPDSVTHAEVAAQVEDAYQRALRGNRSREGVMSEARNFGSARADALGRIMTRERLERLLATARGSG